MRIPRSQLAAALPLALLLSTHLVACSGAPGGGGSAGNGGATPAPVGSIAVAPREASVAAGQTVAFQAAAPAARSAVHWSIAEGGAGGSIDAGGVYTPPASAGVYHVVATSAADPAQVGTATVTVTAATPAGPQLYVATNGDDANAGTLDAPWRTIQKAMSSARPGDTVNIRAGTYTERLTLDVSGTPTAPIVFQNYGFAPPAAQSYGSAAQGDSVVLDYSSLGTVTDGNPFFEINAKSHVVIRGLTFKSWTVDGYARGLRVEGASSSIDFRFCKFLDMINVGQTPPTWTSGKALEAVRVWAPASDINFYSCEFGNHRTTTSEALAFDGASHCTVQWCWFHDVDQIATQAYNNAHHISWLDCLVERAGANRDGSPVYRDLSGIGYYLDAAQSCLIDRCIARDGGVGAQVLAESYVRSAGADESHDHVIRNSLFYRNRSGGGALGIQVGSWYGDAGPYNVEILNNVIYGNAVGCQIAPTSGGIVWENNIVAQNTAQVSYVAGGTAASWGTENYNDFVGGGGPGLGAHDTTSDPLFTNPGAGDFSLQGGSPAAGAGDPALTSAELGATDAAGSPRITGGAVDLGALERR